MKKIFTGSGTLLAIIELARRVKGGITNVRTDIYHHHNLAGD
jgi:hypothetical protein